MKGRVKVAVAGALLTAASVAGAAAFAGGGPSFHERLSGYEEDPLVLSTAGSGEFHAELDAKGQRIAYQLRYAGLEGDVTQAHIHLGGRHQSGGIIAFLCSNLDNGPAGTQACPAAPATISGTITAADVIGPTGQGIAAGEFSEVARAMRVGVTYANVHSTLYPGGEIRAQLTSRHKR
jgi:hypothetical protein